MILSEIVFVTVCLLAVAVFSSVVCRRRPIPFTALLVVIGLFLGWLAGEWEPLHPLQQFQLSPDLVLFVFLPALIFESGYNLDGRQLLKNIAPILMLAIPALFISTLFIGAGLWWLLDMNPLYALLFGALISATDPIAVVALFKELGAPIRLNIIVEGESLFNDATALVVFKVILGIAMLETLQWQDAGVVAGEFVRVFFGGAAIGIVFGLLLSEAIRYVRSSSAVLTLSVVAAYAGFIVSEHMLHVSGVMSVVATSIFLSIWGRSRMPQTVADAMHETWEFIAYICNALLFLLVGISVEVAVLIEHAGAITVAILLVIGVRAITIHGMVPLTTRWFHLPTIGMPERHIMWWGGLKGGLAIAMALAIPEDIPGRDMLLAMTVGVVVFTLLVNASTIHPLMRILGMNQLNDDEKIELSAGLKHAGKHADLVLDRFKRVGIINKVTHRKIADGMHAILHDDESFIGDQQRIQHAYLSLLRVELETLDELFKAGVIPQYTRMDIRQQVQHERDRLCAGVVMKDLTAVFDEPSLLAQVEQYMLKKMREHNFLSGLLMYYQNIRLSQRFRRDVARLMMTESSIKMLKKNESISGDMLLEHLQQRYQQLQASLKALKHDMPEFYRQFSFRMVSQASWFGALSEVSSLEHHGQIGGKAYAQLSHVLQGNLDNLPPLVSTVAEASATELIGSVPLFSGLSENVVNELVAHTVTVTFLPGDMVIGQGEKGDALYILVHGMVRVLRDQEEVAILEEGDFFGEMALLGDHIRSVNVLAVHACKLLRLRRDDVLVLADQHPQINQRLRDADQQRREVI